MRRGAYTLALYAAAPLVWLWMVRRARKAGGEWGIFSAARFGRPDPSAPVPFARAPVWVHAVSLGETRAAQPLLQGLLDRGLPVLLSHTTATGKAEGARLFPAAVASGQLRQAWLPYDFPHAVRGFLQRYTPRCGLLIEREIWPNLLAQARRQGVPMALVSARFSASSLRQAGWMGDAMREALAGLDAVLAQTPEDAQRLEQAGARHVRVTGNLKFDLALPAGQVAAGQAWRRALGRPVVAVASTREGEDEAFAQAMRARAGGGRPVLYMLIPRHPQRFDEAEAHLRKAGLSCLRRSALQARAEGLPPMDGDVDVLLGDTVGEMAFYYAAADVAIVAGSFAPLGGQNLIEACAAGVPVVVGPHTFNFKQAAQDAIEAGAVLRAADPQASVDAALALLDDAERRQAMGQAARDWAATHAGATQRVLQALDEWL